MIVTGQKSWLGHVFAIRGTSFSHTWKRIAFTTTIAIGVVIIHEYCLANKLFWPFETATFGPLGLALGIFLGFRNNESYNRYWNGRKIWGRLVNVSRTFSRQVMTYINASDEETKPHTKDLTMRMIAYVTALRHALRDTEPFTDLKQFMDEAEVEALRGQKNIPMSIAQGMAKKLKALWQKGLINDMHLKSLDESLTEMLGIQGGCERIRATPIPYVYTVLIHRLTAFFCLLSPFVMVEKCDYLTPILTFLISYAFFGLDDLGEELQDPFGITLNDLPLTAINRTIEVNLKQLIEEPEIPELLKPIDHYLE